MKQSQNRRRTPAGGALEEVLLTCVGTSFRIRAAGQRVVPEALTSWGGVGGLLRSLKADGPQTVPQLARARPVARQRIQRLVDECATAGLVEFGDNPAHRRSKLIRLTAKGEATCAEISSKIGNWSETLAGDIDAADLETTAACRTRSATN